ncbi:MULTISPECIES: hypothetical protein [Prochlorococcus]|uniref:hypothetical protein n=1 Tax=Prochlorococcus TaxID=1218 RepID=UPI0005337F9F|nr:MULTISPECIES: hypothetical protein [Prochlorococcus]KGG12768.1 hypothetical protein EV05_0439 [Prochlorococcus sp. MIT 0601]
MKNFLANERSKWILVIGAFAIGTSFTARNVIPYPTECISEEMAYHSPQVEIAKRH